MVWFAWSPICNVMWGDHPPLVTFSTREEILFYQRIKHAGEVTSSVSSQGLTAPAPAS